MEKVTAAEAKQKFGQVMDNAQRGPVQITKHGRPLAVVISAHEYEQDQAQKRDYLERRLALSEQDIKDGNFVDGPEFLNNLRAKYK